MNEFLNWLRHDTVGLLLLAGVGIALLREVVAGRGMVPLPENTRSTGTHALINPGYYNPQARTAQLGDNDRVGPTPPTTPTPPPTKASAPQRLDRTDMTHPGFTHVLSY